jgi:hypothetical protein
MCAPEARGLPGGTRRKPDTDGRANQEGFAMAARRCHPCSIFFRRRARSSERRDGFVFQFGLPHLAAQRTLVVKISDTSLDGKSGFESRL